MDLKQAKTIGAVLAAVALAGGAGYLSARAVHEPDLVRVTETACGIPPASATFAVPLKNVLQSTGSLAVAVGPIDIPAGGGPITLRFDPAIDGRGREVRMVDGIVQLPTGYGRDGQVPEQITLTCRDGAITAVRYRNNGRGSATFNVLREETAAMARPAPVDGAAEVPPSTPVPE